MRQSCRESINSIPAWSRLPISFSPGFNQVIEARPFPKNRFNGLLSAWNWNLQGAKIVKTVQLQFPQAYVT